MKNDIDALLFDVGGTLRHTVRRDDAGKKRKLLQIARILNAEIEADEFTELLSSRAEAYRCWSEDTLVELGEVELWTRWMLPDWPVDVVRKHAFELNRIWRDATGTRTILPEVKELLLQLFRNGYRLGLVSNTTSSEETPAALEELGLTGHFDVVVLSCVIGIKKHDPRILLAAADRMGVDPGRCAYIGNRPERDVVTARRAGFAKTILLHDPSFPLQSPEKPDLVPDLVVNSLKELLDIFPPRVSVRHQSVGGIKTRARSNGYPYYEASLSTMWATNKFSQLGDFFIAAERLGFSCVELNHQVDSPKLAGMDLKTKSICSVHEPCPADISTVTLRDRDWLVSSLDEENRQAGMAAVKRSIDLAKETGAKTIILHAGNVRLDFDQEVKLRRLFNTGKGDTAEYLEIKDAMMKARACVAEAHLVAVKKSLIELLDYAGPYGIRIALENRYHYLDIPIQDEMEFLLKTAAADRLGFLYDVGHAQALDRLGFFPHELWLKRFADRMFGVHLHDVIGTDDHQPPGMGEIDFRMVASYLPKDAFRTCEILNHHSVEQIRSGLKILVESGCINQIG